VIVATEDARAEALWDTIADILILNGVYSDTEAVGKIIEAIAKLCGDSYAEGYQTGTADANAVLGLRQRIAADVSMRLKDLEQNNEDLRLAVKALAPTASSKAVEKVLSILDGAHDHEMEDAIAAKADVEVDAEIVVPCMDGTENHKFVVSDENENVCYCERCGCMEY
jgi:hypothetical protein